MELFDRDDLKKALIYLLPIFIIAIVIVLTTRMPESSKKNDSEGDGKYHYGSDEKPFTIYLDDTRVDLVWSDKEISKAIKGSYSHERSTLLTGSSPEISEKLSTRTFSVNAPQLYGSKIRLSQGFSLGDGEEGISRALSDNCIRNKDNNNCSYYWAFYLDDEEIDYSQLDFSIADDEGAYMKNMLMGKVCELYCRDQLAEGKAHICTSIMITTADKVCDSCTIQVTTPEELDAVQ